MSIVSFDLEGDFAAFRDPTVTTNQTVKVIPSKSALIGLLGALIGIKRTNSFESLYNQDYINLLEHTAVGIQVNSPVSRCTFFTNHRSLIKGKTKPYKTELLINPKYTIYVKSTKEVNQTLLDRLNDNKFVFSPMLGHAYCPARIPQFRELLDVKEVKPDDQLVSTVLLDEVMELKNKYTKIKFEKSPSFPAKVLVERHLHHYVVADSLKRAVLRHYIPVPENGKHSVLDIVTYDSPLSLTKFYSVDNSDHVLCLF
ncbi:MAG: CRISPR-associated protein Cas5 [Candidatus Bathyarchaeota archaeon]|nr:CRISPR-associated protein Cas5 [Candidatus Termiticorpusculum sp.]MCL1970829.1 CRISPR-associated protein Cas5 [Candidatus Termiticorpusculum sp.]